MHVVAIYDEGIIARSTSKCIQSVITYQVKESFYIISNSSEMMTISFNVLLMKLLEINEQKIHGKTLEKLVDARYLRSIRICNFNRRQVEYILSITKVKPVLNQVEIHSNFSQIKMRPFFKSKNMKAAAFLPLGKPRLVNDMTIAFRH